MLVIFDKLNEYWESRYTPKLISTLLLVTFLFSVLLVFLNNFTALGNYFSQLSGATYFLALDSSFTVLLIFEILGLIFLLPKSVADAVGKQFEILSIILLRSAFKEFGQFSQFVLSGEYDYEQLYPMLSDAFGALLIFLVIGFYYKKQKHERITKSDKEQLNFIRFKKVIALLLLVAFLALGFWDVSQVLTNGEYHSSFNTFYTILIFCDILILLYSMRYQSRYSNLFRYSSYAFATILIRLSLSAPAYINALIGVLAGVFVLGLTLAYNKFREDYNG